MNTAKNIGHIFIGQQNCINHKDSLQNYLDSSLVLEQHQKNKQLFKIDNQSAKHYHDIQASNHKAISSSKLMKMALDRLTSRLALQSFYKLRQNWLRHHLCDCQKMVPANPQQISQRLFQKWTEDGHLGDDKKQMINPQIGFLELQSKFSRAENVQFKCNVKQLNKNNLIMKLQNERLSKKVASLQLQLMQGIRRQEKQVAKKRQSLEGLMEELGDKNQLIEELKSSIKIIQKRLGAKQKGMLQCLLQQDSETLRRSLMRLQAVNDKLNFQLQKSRKDIVSIDLQKKKVAQRCSELQKENKKLKQNNFDLQSHRQSVQILRKQATLMEKVYLNKINKTKRLQKQLSQVIKCKQIASEQELIDLEIHSLRKTETESTASVFRRTNSLQSQIQQSKLQSVFNFLFHIAEEGHQIQNSALFDVQEKDLLTNHKQLYLKNQAAHILQKQQIDMSNFFGNSLDEALNPSEDLHIKDKQTIASLQKQCQNMISKICQLKEKQMHIRSVVMNMLKALDLRSMKKETEGILSVICDFFQYSEGERLQIYPPKSRKLFGFI